MTIYTPIPITESIIEKFRPTRLAIKKLAGIYYFCKSIREDITQYTGSGTVWKKRIKKYGKHNIETVWVSDWYHTPEEIQSVALHFSQENQIVESSLWANLKPENGLDGWAAQSKITSQKKRESMLGKNQGPRSPYGSRSKSYSSDVYSWENVSTGIIEVMTAYDFRKKYNIAPGHLYNLIIGDKFSAKGWKLKGIELPPLAVQEDTTIYEWIHIDGNHELSTRSEMIRKYNLNHGNVSKMISGIKGFKSVKGWKIKK